MSTQSEEDEIVSIPDPIPYDPNILAINRTRTNFSSRSNQSMNSTSSSYFDPNDMRMHPTDAMSFSSRVESDVLAAQRISRVQSTPLSIGKNPEYRDLEQGLNLSDATDSTVINSDSNMKNEQETKDNTLANKENGSILTSDSTAQDIDLNDLPPMGGDRPYPPLLPPKEMYQVTYNGPDDPLHPFNWSKKRKFLTCLILCIDCITISWGSSIYAPGVTQLCEQYHVIQVVAILGITLYVLGFAASPIIYAPLSELYGRKGVLVVSGLGFALFQFAVATAENFQTIMICRFFAGFIGAAPMAIVPAVFADMFDTDFRGKAICLFTLGVFVGPILGPVMGSYIVQHTTWRWLNYVVGFQACAVFVAIVLFVEETHHPTILVNKAKLLRKKTGNWGIRAPHEDFELSMAEICETTISKPLIMLFTEPVLLIITIYNSFVYGILYLLLEAYPIIFVEGYGMKTNGFLPYLALIVGIMICSVMIWHADGFYTKKVKKEGKLIPEDRLYPMIVAGIIFPIGILWFCWTGAYPEKIHWICPTIAGSFIGFGLMGIFLPCLNYIIESYLLLTASAVAANTFMRSAFGAVFPLFAGYMFKGMGIGWAGLLIGLFAAAMIPVPFLFLKYGKTIRIKSKYAYDG
ncbi:hypothetical protein TBLA_0A08510 [Henningerozyma blattae CBS 6284]|uniref:Major facilitator superfamily (MFS) profile domain-containing protein n=1 Tax=Henningerozyma blattae (strain ATCC 34711 / CBS 6284 / DSM 70876 / NBRC 10599 / NRRL Y-10934 / UCD 77-7) TaxID=1071380 RepID=I2GWY8_HENB6|nr:hypothetical protein TBLA_0A08510 [Tetrapisispora blattae CBS 6284]CCH58640.1 hypothetical protein TBLA_0A08510 [Tetrapisispora blattae CBS 6284]